MKKLIVLNGSHSDVPLILRGKKLGFEVITLGNDDSLIGHKYADKHINVDFSNEQLVCECAKRERADYICACANDLGLFSACYTSEKLGLPGHDSYEVCSILQHKDMFKKFSKEYDILTPNAKGFNDCDEAIQYAIGKKGKVVVKPVDLGGGKGVLVVDTYEEKKDAIINAFEFSKHKRVVIEDYIDGTNHAMTVFIVDGKIRYCFSDNEYYYKNNYLCCTSLGPADGFELVKDILIRECEKVIKALKLVDGHLHIQYRLDNNNKPWIIEFTRRICGDLYSYPVEQSLGIDESMCIVKAECGLDLSDIPYMPDQKGYVGRHCLMTPKNGIIESYSISKELEQYIVDRLIWFYPNFEIKDYMKDKFGVIVFSFPNRDIAKHFVTNMTSYINFKYK